jgi:hypothetical protein
VWGNCDEEIPISDSDMGDVFPDYFDVSDDGKILIMGRFNKIKIWNYDGSFFNTITPTLPDSRSRHVEPIFINSNLFYISDNYYFMSLTGQLITSFNGPGAIIWKEKYNGFLYLGQNSPDNKWYKYSPTGQLIKTYPSRPLELGAWKEELILNGPNKGTYKVTVKFQNSNYANGETQWVIYNSKAYKNYLQDNNGNLFGIGEKEVIRYNYHGIITDKYTIPENQIEKIPIQGPHPIGYSLNIIAEYGSLVIDRFFNIYTWKRSPDNYKILKWTWNNGQ